MVASLRPSRRTNLALLVLLTAAFLTGWLAFGVGTSPASRIVAVMHGVLGLGLVLLVPWKSVVVRRGLRRRRPHGDALVLAAAVATSIVAGVAHATLGPLAVGGISALDVHVGAAVVAVLFVVLHVRRRPQPVRRADLSRRTLLRALTLAGGAALAYGMVEAAADVARLPGAGRRGTGSYEAGSGRPAQMPVTQWFTDSVPAVQERAHVLTVLEPGRPPRRVAYADLLAAADSTVEAVLDCTGGWWAVQEWRGVRLDRLLGEHDGRSIVVRSVTGYSRRFPVEDAATLLLATHVADRPLSPGHGSPVRLVAPGRRGFWWVKWVDQVSVGDEPWWWQPPFPLQ
jgi:DMSO/TMAO reductase YedYZ molybdopterin-dependent catalytic subunit